MPYLAQPLLLLLQPACEQLVYLRWLSPLNTFEGWAFAGATDTKTDVADATEVSLPDGRAQVAVRRTAADTLTARATNLTASQHAALSTILDSPCVYQQYADGSRRPVLVSANATTTRSSADGKHVLEIDVRLPARNALTN